MAFVEQTIDKIYHSSADTKCLKKHKSQIQHKTTYSHNKHENIVSC